MNVHDLNNQLKYLGDLRDHIIKLLSRLPDGPLRCSKASNRSTYSYFTRQENSGRCSLYIPKSRMDLARALYPDFTLFSLKTGREIIHEHLGMMSDPRYIESAIWRIDILEKNGLVLGESLIITYESEKTHLNLAAINMQIDRLVFGKETAFA